MKKIHSFILTGMLLIIGTALSWSNASTITWMVNGSVYTTTTSTTGVVGSLPKTDPTSFNANYPYFEGWFTEAAGMDGAPDEAAPATQVTTATPITGDVTFYAVFTNAIDGIALKKATSVSNGDIIYLATSDNKTGAGLVSASGGNGYQSSDHTKWLPFTVNGSADNFTLINADKGGITIGNAKFYLGTTPYSQLSFNEDGYFVSSDGYCLFWFGTYFRGYPKATINNPSYALIYMYKPITPGYVSTTCSDGVTVTLAAQETSVNLSENGTASTTVTCSKIGGTGNGTWSYSVTPTTATFDGTTFTATAAGTYTLKATYTESCNTEGKLQITVTATPVVYFTSIPANPVTFPTVECGESTALSDKKAVSVQGYNLTGGGSSLSINRL